MLKVAATFLLIITPPCTAIRIYNRATSPVYITVEDDIQQKIATQSYQAKGNFPQKTPSLRLIPQGESIAIAIQPTKTLKLSVADPYSQTIINSTLLNKNSKGSRTRLITDKDEIVITKRFDAEIITPKKLALANTYLALVTSLIDPQFLIQANTDNYKTIAHLIVQLSAFEDIEELTNAHLIDQFAHAVAYFVTTDTAQALYEQGLLEEYGAFLADALKGKSPLFSSGKPINEITQDLLKIFFIAAASYKAKKRSTLDTETKDMMLQSIEEFL